MRRDEVLVMALPAGRILDEVMPLLARAGIVPEASFQDPATRQLRFRTAEPGLELVRVRAFDVATMVAFGAAELGIAGADVIMEFDYPELYAPVDLGLARCRLVVASLATLAPEDPTRASRVRVATKYPGLARRHFASRGIEAECIKLHGSIELAPSLGLCERIVDLTESGRTLAANGLVETEEIARSSARLVVNRTAMKTRAAELGALIGRVERAVEASRHAA